MRTYWVLVGVLWFVLVSCAFGDLVDQTEQLGGIEDAVVGEESIAGEVSGLEGARTPGGVLRYPVTACSEPDPAIDRSIGTRNIANPPLVAEIHAGLTRVDEFAADGYGPELASSVTVSGRLDEYRFTLRPELKFSDGSLLTSTDVKWSWERALSLGAETSRAWHVLGVIDGADEVLGLGGDLSGFEVIDDRRFDVRLVRPFVNFPLNLADPIASVLSRGNAETWPERFRTENTSSVFSPFDFEHEVVGAGRFRLLAGGGDPLIAMGCSIERNPHYWGEPSSLARVDFVPSFESFPSAADIGPVRVYEMFAQGEIDVSMPEPEARDSGSFAGNDASLGIATVHGDGSYGMLVFNPVVPPFDAIEFRRALVSVTDVAAALSEGQSGGFTRHVVPRSVLRNSEAGAMTSPQSSYEVDVPGRKFSEVVIDVPFDRPEFDDYGRLMRRIVAQWEESLGLTVRLDSRPSVYDNSHRAGELPFRVMIGRLQVPEPLHQLRRLASAFGSRHASEEFRVVSEMLMFAEAESDSVVREEMALDIERYLLENALVLPLVLHESEFEVRVQPWVRGFEYWAYPHSLFAGVWLEDAPPERLE